MNFKEWIIEEMSRRDAMVHEERPDIAPEAGQIVIVLDKPVAKITNDDVYSVASRDDNGIVLSPKVGERNLIIPYKDWKNFTHVTHLITPNERTWFGGKPVWAIGAGKDKWIGNREKMKRRSQAPTSAPPQEFTPLQISKVRSQLSGRQEEPEVAAARNWLRGVPS